MLSLDKITREIRRKKCRKLVAERTWRRTCDLWPRGPSDGAPPPAVAWCQRLSWRSPRRSVGLQRKVGSLSIDQPINQSRSSGPETLKLNSKLQCCLFAVRFCTRKLSREKKLIFRKMNLSFYAAPMRKVSRTKESIFASIGCNCNRVKLRLKLQFV